MPSTAASTAASSSTRTCSRGSTTNSLDTITCICRRRLEDLIRAAQLGVLFAQPADLCGLGGGHAVAVAAVNLVDGTLTADIATRVTAQLVVEGANGPSTPQAEAVLHAAGIAVLPDLLANAGGVISSYYEWVQNHQRLAWPEGDERRRVLERLDQSWSAVAAHDPDQWRTIALTTAISRVLDGMRAAGTVPPADP